MLLAIDIGNTNISLAVFKRNKILKKFYIPTKEYNIQKIKKPLAKFKIKDSIICSVVPQATRTTNRDIKKLLHRRPYVLGQNINVPIKNLYRRPKQVGQDRLVNAYTGIVFYGAPLIIIDFGTAVTFDIISKRKEYRGGLILPGLDISLDILAKKAALLPKIKLSKPKELIGRDTKSSMLSGVIYGFAGLVDSLIGRLKKKIGKSVKIIGTGGNIDLIRKYCKQFDKIDKDLTLKGLNLLYRDRSIA